MNCDTIFVQYLVAYVLAVLLTFGLLLALLLTASENGPHCPGKDPQWLGFCSEAPSPV